MFSKIYISLFIRFILPLNFILDFYKYLQIYCLKSKYLLVCQVLYVCMWYKHLLYLFFSHPQKNHLFSAKWLGCTFSLLLFFHRKQKIMFLFFAWFFVICIVQCRPDEFRCQRGGGCISTSAVCDSIPDCDDMSDELPSNCPGTYYFFHLVIFSFHSFNKIIRRILWHNHQLSQPYNKKIPRNIKTQEKSTPEQRDMYVTTAVYRVGQL